MSETKSIKKRLDEIVYDRVLNDLLKGVYKEGTEFVPMNIAEMYGVSITPVTIALKRMYFERIVDRTSGGKYFVPVFSVRQFVELCDARYMIELRALEALIEKRGKTKNSEILDKINDCARDCFKYADQGDIVHSIRSDLGFHQMIVQTCENEFFDQFFLTIRNKIICWSYSEGFTSLHQRTAATEHFVLVEAIVEGDKTKAFDLIYKHIDEACLRVAGKHMR